MYKQVSHKRSTKRTKKHENLKHQITTKSITKCVAAFSGNTRAERCSAIQQIQLRLKEQLMGDVGRQSDRLLRHPAGGLLQQ